MIRYVGFWAMVLWLLQGCALFGDKEGEIVQEYENIAIYADLSRERLDMGVRDTGIIRDIALYARELQSIGQRNGTTVRFSRLNYNTTDCPSPEMKAGAGTSEKEEWLEEIRIFSEGVACHYRVADEVDLDAASLIAGIVAQGDFLKVESDMDETGTGMHHRLMVFMDGYLDFASSQLGENFRLGTAELEVIRQRCLLGNRLVYDVLRDCPEFRIQPILHPNHAKVDLYLLETGDRSSVGSGDLSDNHILEVLWELWALESGFRSLTWKAFSREGDLPANYFRGLFEVPEDSDPDMTPYGEGGACPEGVEEEVEEETIRPVRRSQPAEAVIARPLEPVSVSRIRDYAIPQVSGLVRETNLFSLPDPATVVKTLPAGTRIEVLGYGGRYYRVRVDGDLGYVQESAVWTYRNKQ